MKLALEAGAKSLEAGELKKAEQSFVDALELAPDDRVAQVGRRITKQARVGMLESAVADAKRSGNVDRVAAELQKTLELDPGSQEARTAFRELLEEADRQAQAGNDPQTASLLLAANTVSRPASAKKKIAAAIARLKAGEHHEAEQAFDAILKTGKSDVARTGLQAAKTRRKASLMVDLAKLESGEDVTRGAMAAQKLFLIDPADSAAKRAVDATLSRAERSAANGDDRLAARELRAAAIALNEEKEAKKAIQNLERGRYVDAEDMFGYSSDSLIATKGQAIAKGRRMGTLTKSLSADGEDAARAIRALLAADPNNKEARQAFLKLLADARQAGRKGEDKNAAEKLRLANVAAGATNELDKAIGSAAGQLADARHAEAEKSFSSAMELAKDSEVAKVGLEVSRQRRQRLEQEASRAITQAEDPRPHAQILKSSLLLDPNSKAVSSALRRLVDRANKSAKKGQDVETAQVLEAASLLENGSPEAQVKIAEASGLYAKGSFEQAEGVFLSVNGGGSQVAELGKTLARGRRIAMLEDQWIRPNERKIFWPKALLFSRSCS